MRKAVREITQALLLLIILCLGAEMPKSQAKATQTLISHGNLIYEDARGSVSLYAADILLLEEKLSSVPERCFDPAGYARAMTYGVVDACCFEEEEFEAPETDGPPETPEIGEPPEAPETPETDEPPETSESPGTDEPPETPEPPENDEPSETPEAPETGETSEAPETPEAPEIEETPDK